MDDQPRTTDVHSKPTAVTTEPTTSGLVYLFAHELIPSDTSRITRNSVKASCQENIRLPHRPLANLLLATAFWSLREQGRIALELDKRVRLRVRAIDGEQARLQGLEAQLMASLPMAGSSDVSSVIYNCWQDDSINPWNDVVQAAAQAVSDISQDCSMLATFAGAFAGVVQRWQRFQTSEPVLYQALLDECVRGIVARKQGDPAGTGKRPDRGSGVDLGEVVVAAALGAGLAVAGPDDNAATNTGADTIAEPRGFFDFLGSFFDGLGDFFGDFFDGMGDFFGGDFDGGFDFD